jgi:outer membrane protein OmpA-like peptidoglycan-associated protein
MNLKKGTVTVILAYLALIPIHPEVLTWRANAGQEFQAKTTVSEAIVGLDYITEKPTDIVTTTINQEKAASVRSTISYLSGIPTFPRSAVEPGAVWKEKASVSYNLTGFGIEAPLVVETEVTYTFVEKTDIDTRSYYHIKADWFPRWIPDAKLSKSSGLARINGHSSMDLFWDNKSGCPKKTALDEQTQFRFADNTQLLVKRATTQDFMTITDVVRERVVRELKEKIKTQKVENVEVKQTDEGIVLSVENIQFEAESSVLVDSEKKKLTGIGALLSSLADRKISVVGHAANIAGSDAKELETLSAARAQAVADFLVQAGFMKKDMIVAKGMGGSVPLASNDTSEGRTKNRRVEIVIMDEEVTE